MRGDVVRKLLSLILILSLLVIPCGCVSKDSVSIGIVPLDSRPCNTQYAQLLGEMAGYQVVLPDGELLDDFTVPSEPLPLWDWLNEQDCDHYILSLKMHSPQLIFHFHCYFHTLMNFIKI